MSADEVEESKGLHIFGRDVSLIPCFRSSFLYGIGTGFAGGLSYFMFTSRPGRATHVGFGTFFVSTFIYWGVCRHRYAVTKLNTAQIKQMTRMPMKKVAPGIDSESKVESDTK